MEISKEDFFASALKNGIAKEQVESLWASLEKKDIKSTSPISMWLFYFGALIVISAMTWMMSISWEIFGGGGIFIISIAYALFFTWLGSRLWKKESLKVPGGLLIAMAVCMTPLAIYGLETYLNIFPENSPEGYRSFFYLIKSSWIFMEIGTMIAGVIALWFFPFPFLTAPIFFAAWYLSMDSLPLLTGSEGTWEQKQWITLCFGILLLFISYVIQRQKKLAYAFWGYLFGTFVFWASLTSLTWDKGHGILFFYFIMNILLMFLSILLKVRVLMVFGALGAFTYLSYLAYTVFENSLLFPFVMSCIGLLIIYLGVLYQKNSLWIEQKVLQGIPSSLRHFFPSHKE